MAKKDMLTIVILLLVAATLILSAFSVYMIYRPTDQSFYGPLVARLDKHSEFRDYSGMTPRITKLSAAFVDLMKQNNVSIYADARADDLLLEYGTFTAIYDYQNDKVVATQYTLPQDFFSRLLTIEGMQAYSAVVPSITVLTQDYLDQMDETNATFFADAQKGMYLVEYPNLVLIYDYFGNRVVNFYRTLTVQDVLVAMLQHPETKDLINQTVQQVVRLDQPTLTALKQTSPQVYRNAGVGDYVFRYQNTLVIYNFERDLVVGKFTFVSP